MVDTRLRIDLAGEESCGSTVSLVRLPVGNVFDGRLDLGLCIGLSFLEILLVTRHVPNVGVALKNRIGRFGLSRRRRFGLGTHIRYPFCTIRGWRN